jgi:hypothetical protein
MVQMEVYMSTPIKLPDDLINEAKRYAAAYSRSVPKQIEHWSHIGKIAEENPDLPYSFIHGLLLSMEEAEAGEITDFKLKK